MLMKQSLVLGLESTLQAVVSEVKLRGVLSGPYLPYLFIQMANAQPIFLDS